VGGAPHGAGAAAPAALTGEEDGLKGLAFLLLLGLVWASGLLAFAHRVAVSTPAPEPPVADGVVALTGGSNLRLEAAEQLMEGGKARRMLISGVNRKATRADVKGVARGVGRMWDCCVDLGFYAANTRGNAQEIAGWAGYHGYRSLIVVTADYHMPRALLELKAQTPGVQLYPYPVQTDLDARRWWRSSTGARRMALEYCKYLVILGREAIRGLGRRAGQERSSTIRAPAGAGA
jgi:uncharacterized SAM-binding protein YcdF (DUF218 family)